MLDLLGCTGYPIQSGICRGRCTCAGAVSFAVLNFYINAMGGKLKFSLLMSWFLLVEAARVGATVWLSHWTDTVDAPGGAPHGPLWFLMIYTIISAVQVGLMRLASAAPA